MPKRVEVWLKQPNKRIDAFYDFAVPEAFEDRVVPGIRVVVPFGSGNKAMEGFITAVKQDSAYEEKLKDLLAIIDEEPVLTWNQIRLSDWIRRYYYSMFYEALVPFTAPVRVIVKRPLKDDPEKKPRFVAYSARYQSPMGEPSDDFALTPALQELLDGYVCDDLDIHEKLRMSAFFQISNSKQRFDLYCAVAKKEQEQGKQTLILYPESLLAKHYHLLFVERFGDRGVLCYGNQKPAARYKAYEQVRRDEADVILGSRAALFLPAKRIGTIIIDSPWDSSFTAMAIPRYDTLRTAKAYCRMMDAALVMGGSVIPVGVMAEIKAGLTKLYKTTMDIPLIPEIIDLKRELRRGNRSLISGTLDAAIRKNLAEKKKTLLLLNRAGYSGAAFCRDCGAVSKCPHCDVNLRSDAAGKLFCHYCGYEKPMEAHCPVCGSKRYQPSGIGVQQAEAFLKKRYPKADLLRVDGSVIDSMEAYEAMCETIAAGNWDMIIGTNMLLKGFDFGVVSLAAVLLMDGAFNLSDYTASEEAYLLYKQFFALSSGQILGQTYQPEHEVIQALQGDPSGFYESELQYRKLLNYPPYGHMVVFTLPGMEKDKLCDAAQALSLVLNDTMSQDGSENIAYRSFSPTYEGIRPKDSVHQYRLLLKIKNLEAFHSCMWKLINAGEIERLDAKVSIQIDPKAVM